MKYVNTTPDFNLSPYTGMTKKHWMEVAEFLLEGLFTNIKGWDDPIIVKRADESVGYPSKGESGWNIKAEQFEGLARSFMLAGPVIENNPEITIGGYNLADYYANQILKALDPASPNFVGGIAYLQKHSGMVNLPFQQTCECAALVISLMASKEHIWDKYTKSEQDIIARYLSEMGHYRTHRHNWRLFNMLILAFLDLNGYEIDKAVMNDHATNILSYDVGEGWYRDGQTFDYYSPWAFQVYGPLWNNWYGYEHAPEMAKAIEASSNELMKSYPNFFDKDGHVNMWGRSTIYRNAAASPLAANFLLENHTMDPGLARRILSGSLMQFVTKEEMFVHGVPCLGFYGPFNPMVQDYSCAMSPFWFSKAFLCLSLEDDHPFWTATENNGEWEEGTDKEINLVGPGINILNHKETGTTEIRTSKVMLAADHKGKEQYSRLAFNTKFPWEAANKQGLMSMQYSLGDSIPNTIMYSGIKEGVLYRRAYFDFEGVLWNAPYIDLADIPLDNGILRIDRVNIVEKPYDLNLSHYGLPHIDGHIDVHKHLDQKTPAIIAKTKGLQLAMVTYRGWHHMDVVTNTKTNPVTDESTLIYANTKEEKLYGQSNYILITAMLHKTDDSDWTDDALYPVKDIIFENEKSGGNQGTITIILKNGKTYTVDFKGQEGRLSI